METPSGLCASCSKPLELCVCDQIPKGLEYRIRVLILQHPQESDRLLGSARLAQLCLPGAELKIGLSWPNLSKALGLPKAKAKAEDVVHPSRWAVLYLGSGIKTAAPGKTVRPGLHFVSKSGNEIPTPDEPLDGFVVLDGTWSQAKALWWRNAWLLKLKRAILIPRGPSLYRELRKEPRRECLSTIETIAETLQALGEPEPTVRALREVFAMLLEKQRSRLRAKASRSQS